MKKILIASMAVLPMLAGNVHADRFYMGAKISSLDVDPIDESFTTIIFSGGLRVNDWLSVEAHLGKSDDQTDSFGDRVEIESLAGIYAKLNGRNNVSNISPYVSVGYTRVTVDDSFLGSASESGVSLGLGLDFRVNDNFYIGLGYMSYLDEDEDKIKGAGLGVNYLF